MSLVFSPSSVTTLRLISVSTSLSRPHPFSSSESLSLLRVREFYLYRTTLRLTFSTILYFPSLSRTPTGWGKDNVYLTPSVFLHWDEGPSTETVKKFMVIKSRREQMSRKKHGTHGPGLVVLNLTLPPEVPYD